MLSFKRGFTLVELLVVIAIIMVLMAIGIVSYRQAGIKTRNGKRQTDLETVRQALVLLRNEAGYYPNAAAANNAYKASTFTEVLSVLTTQGFLNSDTIADPKQGHTYTYTAGNTGRTFTLTADTEPFENGETITIQNP